MVGAALLGGRLADADPHPRELVGVQMLLDRSQTVVAGQAAADLQPQHRRFEIELVVHDDNPIRFDAETPRQRADRLSRLVHVGEWDRERDPLVTDAHLVAAGATLRSAQLPTVSAGEELDDLGADVVTRTRELVAGIAEP